MATQHRARASLGLAVACVLLVIASACGAQTPQRLVYYPRPAPAPAVEDQAPAADPPPDAAPTERTDAPALSGPVPQLVRQAVPAAPRPLAGLPAGAIGRIEIPSIGLSHPVYEGMSLDEIDLGPSHWPGTAMPGQAGNAVFAGHRVTHTHPFLNIDQLQPGDQIVLTTQAGRFVYQMTDSLIVTPDATWIADPTRDATLTLYACHPKHQQSHRYVVRGHLVSAQLAAAPASPAPPPKQPPPPPPQQSSPPPTSPPTTAPSCRWLCLRR